MEMPPLAVVILAAGKGTRMQSTLPKVLHNIAGRSMINHVVAAAASLEAETIILITGHGGQDVQRAVRDAFSEREHLSERLCFIEQAEQLGTGHAVQHAQEALTDFSGDVLVLSGDCPLVTCEELAALRAYHKEQGADISFISALVENPAGLGRVLRGEKGNVTGIIEHKEATPRQLDIKEINTGLYLFKAPAVFDWLKEVKNENVQGEYYLPDCLPIALQAGGRVAAWDAGHEGAKRLLGINSRAQLSKMETLWQEGRRQQAMDEGVTLRCPPSTFFSFDTHLGRDIELGPNVRFGPGVRVEDNVTIEGSCYLRQCTVGKGARLTPFCYVEGADIQAARTTNPFTCIAPDGAADMQKLVALS